MEGKIGQCHSKKVERYHAQRHDRSFSHCMSDTNCSDYHRSEEKKRYSKHSRALKKKSQKKVKEEKEHYRPMRLDRNYHHISFLLGKREGTHHSSPVVKKGCQNTSSSSRHSSSCSSRSRSHSHSRCSSRSYSRSRYHRHSHSSSHSHSNSCSCSSYAESSYSDQKNYSNRQHKRKRRGKTYGESSRKKRQRESEQSTLSAETKSYRFHDEKKNSMRDFRGRGEYRNDGNSGRYGMKGKQPRSQLTHAHCDLDDMPQIVKNVYNELPHVFPKHPPDSQTLMFSATWPSGVRRLAETFLHEFVQVNTGARQLSANHNITQIVDVVDETEKDEKLMELVQTIMAEKENKTLIFAKTKVRVDELTRLLQDQEFSAVCVHSDKKQKERNWAMNEFRNGRSRILVATDVTSRGLDVDDIKYVINVDFPNTSEDYIHRIGITARSNKSGTAYTFFTFSNMKQARDLVAVLKEADQEINPKLLQLVKMSESFRCGPRLRS